MKAGLTNRDGPPVKRIGVVLLGILGDVLTRTPTVREIRKLYPHAHIQCFVDPIGYEGLQNSPDIDSFKIVYRSRIQRYRYLKSKLDTLAYLVTHKFDLFIDLYGNSWSRLMAKFARARTEIIVADGAVQVRGVKEKRDALKFTNVHHLSNNSLQILRYFDTEQISLDPRPVVDLKSKAMTVAERTYIDCLIEKHKRVFVISAGSGDIKKMIPVGLCVSIARSISQSDGAHPLLLFNPGSRDIQCEIALALDKAGLSYSRLQRLSIPAVVYLLRQSAFVVVSDSGILHLSVAVGSPFLGVFTHTPPEEVIPQSGIFETCFKPHPDAIPYGTRGLVYGDQSISEQDVLPKLDMLLQKIKRR
ncbi:glycosyltransferase family 9 protein [beta proteobacterium MWH-UniP1]